MEKIILLLSRDLLLKITIPILVKMWTFLSFSSAYCYLAYSSSSISSAHRFAAFADNPASCTRRNLDVCLQFDLFFCRKKVLLFQLSKYPTLGLKYKEDNEAGRVYKGKKSWFKTWNEQVVYLKLSFGSSCNNNHSLSNIWTLSWGYLM